MSSTQPVHQDAAEILFPHFLITTGIYKKIVAIVNLVSVGVNRLPRLCGYVGSLCGRPCDLTKALDCVSYEMFRKNGTVLFSEHCRFFLFSVHILDSGRMM